MRKNILSFAYLWVDDLTLTVPISLKENLIQDTRDTTAKPVPYHGRTGHGLPIERNAMQIQLDNLSEYCRQANMSIKKQKTKCMLFNKSKKMILIPELSLSYEAKLEVVKEMKLVGYQITSDLSPTQNT